MKVEHWIAFIATHKCFDDGWEKVTLLLRLYGQGRTGDITELVFSFFSSQLPSFSQLTKVVINTNVVFDYQFGTEKGDA